jgi:hypothetical protein
MKERVVSGQDRLGLGHFRFTLERMTDNFERRLTEPN